MLVLGQDHRKPEHTGLAEHAGQKRRCSGWCHRIGRRQPRVQGPHAAFDAEPHRGQSAGNIQKFTVRTGRGKSTDLRDANRTEQMIQQEQSHQSDQTADYGIGQIAVGGIPGISGLIMCHQHPGGHAHHLEEDEHRVQICGKEHADGGSFTDQKIQVKPVFLRIRTMNVQCVDRHREPHGSGDQAEDPSEAVQFKPDPESEQIRKHELKTGSP